MKEAFELLPFIKLGVVIFAIPAIAFGGRFIIAIQDWRGR